MPNEKKKLFLLSILSYASTKSKSSIFPKFYYIFFFFFVPNSIIKVVYKSFHILHFVYYPHHSLYIYLLINSIYAVYTHNKKYTTVLSVDKLYSSSRETSIRDFSFIKSEKSLISLDHMIF